MNRSPLVQSRRSRRSHRSACFTCFSSNRPGTCSHTGQTHARKQKKLKEKNVSWFFSVGLRKGVYVIFTFSLYLLFPLWTKRSSFFHFKKASSRSAALARPCQVCAYVMCTLTLVIIISQGILPRQSSNFLLRFELNCRRILNVHGHKHADSDAHSLTRKVSVGLRSVYPHHSLCKRVTILFRNIGNTS